MNEPTKSPVVHFVGSIPLPDSETVFRTLSSAVGGHVARLPDGETGIRKSWIRFLQDVLAESPAIELPRDVPPFKFVQWDGKVIREIPRLRIKPGMTPDRKASRPAMPKWPFNRSPCSTGCKRPASFRRASNSRSASRPRSRRPITIWCRPTGRSCCRR